MGQRIVHRFDAVMVIHEIIRTVGAADGMGGLDAQFPFQGRDENLKGIKEQGFRGCDDAGDFGVHQCADDNGADAVRVAGIVDPFDESACFFGGIDKWNSDFLESHAVELGQQAVAEHFRSNAGAIGDEKSGA